MKKLLAFLFIISNIAMLQAQGEFIYGYLILTNGDTLRGTIQNSPNYELTGSLNISIDNEVKKEIIFYGMPEYITGAILLARD
jgi:hypothetical protein